MDTMLVRLKPYDPRRGFVLRRYTYLGIKFHEERGWYRVDKPVADYLRTVREEPDEEYTPLAFDVCTDAEAQALDAKETDEAKVRRAAADEVKLSAARTEASASMSALTTADLEPAKAPSSASTSAGADTKGAKKDR